MTTVPTNRLVEEYLTRLEAAAAHMQRARRAELVAEIREHIEAALRQEQTADEAAIRNVLERLGAPDEIVDAAEPPPADGTGRAGALEIVALVALIIPLIGWIVGIVLVLVSRAWANREKTIGIALALLPALVPLVLLSLGGESGSPQSSPVGEGPAAGLDESDGGLGPLEIGALVLGLLAGLPSAIYLGVNLRRRAAT